MYWDLLWPTRTADLAGSAQLEGLGLSVHRSACWAGHCAQLAWSCPVDLRPTLWGSVCISEWVMMFPVLDWLSHLFLMLVWNKRAGHVRYFSGLEIPRIWQGLLFLRAMLMNILFQAELTDGKVFYTTDTVLRIHVLFQRWTLHIAMC